MMAWEFAAAGMDVLILAYHGEPGLPKLLKDQPVDVIEKAAMWLKARGYEKIGSGVFPWAVAWPCWRGACCRS